MGRLNTCPDARNSIEKLRTVSTLSSTTRTRSGRKLCTPAFTSAPSACRRDVKRLIKRSIGGPNSQRRVQNQQRLPHRIDDVLRVVLNVVNQWN